MYLYQKDYQLIIKLVDENTTASWEELKDLLNDTFEDDKTIDGWRKATLRARNIEASNSLQANVNEEQRKLTLDKQYIRYERTKNYEQIRDLTIHSILSDEVKTAIAKSLPKVEEVVLMNNGEDEFTFVTSDFHYNGEEKYLNLYNHVYTQIIEQQKKFGFTKIRLLELGDIIDGGSLRPSQLYAIKKGMVSQIIDVSRIYAQLINELSKTMKVDFYCVTSSNHTQLRPLGTKQNELVEEDLMRVFAEYVSIALSINPNVKVFASEEMIVPMTDKHSCFIAHGHLVKEKKGYLQEVAMKRNIQLDYGLFGHYHHYREVTLYEGNNCNKKVFYAPSMSPFGNSYEDDRNLSSKNGILMMVFNSNRGHKYCEELFL